MPPRMPLGAPAVRILAKSMVQPSTKKSQASHHKDIMPTRRLIITITAPMEQCMALDGVSIALFLNEPVVDDAAMKVGSGDTTIIVTNVGGGVGGGTGAREARLGAGLADIGTGVGAGVAGVDAA